jgi:hypothetical protein
MEKCNGLCREPEIGRGMENTKYFMAYVRSFLPEDERRVGNFLRNAWDRAVDNKDHIGRRTVSIALMYFYSQTLAEQDFLLQIELHIREFGGKPSYYADVSQFLTFVNAKSLDEQILQMFGDTIVSTDAFIVRTCKLGTYFCKVVLSFNFT